MRFWEIYEDVRRTRDFVDYAHPHAVSRAFPHDAGFPEVAELVLGYP